MGPGFYCYVGVFEDGKLLYRIGGKIFVPEEEKDKYLLFLNGFAGLIDKYYKPIGREYVAFDYE